MSSSFKISIFFDNFQKIIDLLVYSNILINIK